MFYKNVLQNYSEGYSNLHLKTVNWKWHSHSRNDVIFYNLGNFQVKNFISFMMSINKIIPSPYRKMTKCFLNDFKFWKSIPYPFDKDVSLKLLENSLKPPWYLLKTTAE